MRTKDRGLRHKVAGVTLLGAGAVDSMFGAWTLQAEIAAGLFTGYALVKKSNRIL